MVGRAGPDRRPDPERPARLTDMAGGQPGGARRVRADRLGRRRARRSRRAGARLAGGVRRTCCRPTRSPADPDQVGGGLAGVADPPGRRAQPGAGGARAQPGDRVRRSPSRRATPTATRIRRRARRAHRRPGRARARATGRDCSRRPSTRMVADRFTRAVCWVLSTDDALRGLPAPGPDGQPTAPTASSTWPVTGSPRSRR